MAIDVIMPKLGESITEGTILEWKKSLGDSIERDETLLEISTDKVDSEIPSPASGTLLEILYEKNADIKIFPASMTKIMTSLIAFELIESGDLTLDEKFFISENAWRWSQAGYSSMFILVGDQVSVENLLRGIIVASGNDACIALAEGIAGTEDEFAIMMTTKAKEIGMTNTNFSNSSGMTSAFNYSTVEMF